MMGASLFSSTALSFLLIWGSIGCVFFFVSIIVLFLTGLVYTARKQDGTLKDEISLSGKYPMTNIPLSFTIFLLLANKISLYQNDNIQSLWQIITLNYGLYLILFLFDTFFIDGFTLAVWRPKFLKIPDEIGRESMRKQSWFLYQLVNFSAYF